MRKTILSFLTISSVLITTAQQPAASLPLIPEPVSQQVNPGHFILPGAILIDAPHQPDLLPTLRDLATRLTTPTGYSVTFLKVANPAATDGEGRLFSAAWLRVQCI